MLNTGLVRWAFGVNGAFICSPTSTPPPDELIDYVLRSTRGSWLGRERVEPEGGGIDNWIGYIPAGFKTRDLLSWGTGAGNYIYYRGLPILPASGTEPYAFGDDVIELNVNGACLLDTSTGCKLIWMIGRSGKIYAANFDRETRRISSVSEKLEVLIERENAVGTPYGIAFDWEALRFNASGNMGYMIGVYDQTENANPTSYFGHLYGDTVVKITIDDDLVVTATADVETVSDYEWTNTRTTSGSASATPEIDQVIQPGSGDYDFSDQIARVTHSRVLVGIDFADDAERRAYIETTITETTRQHAVGTWPRTKSTHLTVQSSGDAAFYVTENVESFLVLEGATTQRIPLDDKTATEIGTGVPANVWQSDEPFDFFLGDSAIPFGGTWNYQRTRAWSNVYALDLRFGVVVLAQEETSSVRTYTFTDPEEYFADPDYLARADFSVTPRITTGSKNWRIEANTGADFGSASIYTVRDSHEPLQNAVFLGDQQYFDPPWQLFDYAEPHWSRVYAPTESGSAAYPSGTIGAPEIDDYESLFNGEILTGENTYHGSGPDDPPIHDPAPEGWRRAEIDRYVVPDTGQVGVNESAIFVSLYFDADTGDDYINGIYDYELRLQASAARLKTATNLPGDNQDYSKIRLMEVK